MPGHGRSAPAVDRDRFHLMRKMLRCRDGWRFRHGENPGAEAPDFDDAGWEPVVVPHDWAIRGPFGKLNDAQFTRIVNDGEAVVSGHFGRTGGLPHVGHGTYRLRFDVDAGAAGKHFFFVFDGVMSHSSVFINGHPAGGRPYGYSSFAVDATPWIVPGGGNLLCVRAENLPSQSRWYPGAGIIRDVHLITADPLHVAPWGLWIRTAAIRRRRAELTIGVTASASFDSFDYAITDAAGREMVRGRMSGGAVATAGIEPFAAWDLDAPHLYTATVTLRNGRGEATDTVSQRFGIREMRFDAECGMRLNGRPVVFKGVCQHHDLGPLGAAFSMPAARRQLEILRSVGVNAIRTAHNPPAPGLLDLCDEMGFLVIDEAFDCWQIAKVENDYHLHFDAWAERDLVDLVVRDRNHPCVVLWSIGNEMLEQNTDGGWRVAARLRDIVHRTDPDRPVTAGLSFGDAALDKGMAAEIDVPGFNYKPRRYQEYHERLPGRPIYGSETASVVSSRGEYAFPVEERLVTRPSLQMSSYDVEYPSWATSIEEEFTFQDRHPWIMGEFVWSGFDYLGEPSPYNHHWPAHASYFGIFDLCGLPKNRAYLYKSRWTREPVLHLLPHWNWPNRAGLATPVHCYTSHETVELFLNGVSQGVRSKQGAYRLVWNDVVYAPGELRAVARAAGGSVLQEVVVRTTGAPAAIRLEPEQSEIPADGESLFFVRVALVDARGDLHPTASDRVAFKVDGPADIAAVANGDSTSLETFDQNHVRVFNGQALVVLRSHAGSTGTVVLSAAAEHLSPASVKLRAVARA